MRFPKSAATAVGLVLVMSGCGGSDGDAASEPVSDDEFCASLVALAEKIPTEPDPDRSTDGDLELVQAAAEVAPPDARPAFDALANAIAGLENRSDPPARSWEPEVLLAAREAALDAAAECGVEFVLLQDSPEDGLLQYVVAGGPGAFAEARPPDAGGGDREATAESVCADFADEVGSVESGTNLGPTLAKAAKALDELDADEPKVADLAAAMGEAGSAKAALFEAAAGAAGVSPEDVTLLLTDDGVFVYPTEEGLNAVQPVPNGTELNRAALQADVARRRAAEAAGLEECAVEGAAGGDSATSQPAG